MRKWIVMLVFALCAAVPAAATPMTGADGLFAPATDYTLPYRADGLFDFTGIDIGAGVTVRTDSRMQNVTLRALGDILIAGAIDAIGTNLVLETPGQLVLSGSISAGGVSLTSLAGNRGVGRGAAGGGLCLSIVGTDGCGTLGGLLLTPGELEVRPGGDITLSAPGTLLPGGLQVRPGGDIILSAPGAGVFAVPEPATFWLVTLLLPMLARFGRKRV